MLLNRPMRVLFQIIEPDLEELLSPINTKWLKLYYH